MPAAALGIVRTVFFKEKLVMKRFLFEQRPDHFLIFRPYLSDGDLPAHALW